MRARIVSSILVAGILVAGYSLSCEYIETIGGQVGLVVYASLGTVLTAVIVIRWLWRD